MYTKTKKYLLLATGWIALTLGIFGVVLPLLPTTPFVLLAAACFAKSSPRFHHWLLTHKFFGPIIHNFQSGKGIPKQIRNNTILFIWLTMGISMLVIATLWSTILLITIGASVTIYLMRQPVYEKSDVTPIK